MEHFLWYVRRRGPTIIELVSPRYSSRTHRTTGINSVGINPSTHLDFGSYWAKSEIHHLRSKGKKPEQENHISLAIVRAGFEPVSLLKQKHFFTNCSRCGPTYQPHSDPAVEEGDAWDVGSWIGSVIR
jgi:hypothetical protein